MSMAYTTYTKEFTTTTCKATLRRLTASFLPYYVKEPTALAVPEVRLAA
jgi:hypothetical protein